ncbi:MAG: TetR/AcrR family transcriptional regulator [Phycisphaerales bacterium]|jgi:TetR/AcrR family transcriptional regulator, regulator of cefoperazone and chloramphenicol sensitivity|nr:TetR/AcrR family transcriptional regulator [Phycisphaerales bacterium]MBT7170623.1 TetR/AcrR family transcriptional regulator [Phycisphaerales bacterium]
MSEPKSKQPTKQRLLQAACEVFAENGYRGATVAEICKRAEANIAAVNYHFGDKERLYIAAWRRALDVAIEKYPLDGGVPHDAPPEERLHGRIESLIRKTMDEGEVGHMMRFLVAEISMPSGKVLEALTETVQPLRRTMLELVRELAGEEMSDQDVVIISTSIYNICSGLVLRPEMRKNFFGKVGIDQDMIIDTATRLVLGGIKEMCK